VPRRTTRVGVDLSFPERVAAASFETVVDPDAPGSDASPPESVSRASHDRSTTPSTSRLSRLLEIPRGRRSPALEPDAIDLLWAARPGARSKQEPADRIGETVVEKTRRRNSRE